MPTKRRSKKHHYVPQAQLRRFSIDGAGRRIWIFDKMDDRAYPGAIQDAGSENGFNTVQLETGGWNFEDLFQDVDSRSATLIARILERRSVARLGSDGRAALNDLLATQMLRTHLARTSPRHIAGRLRDIARDLGHDPDADAGMAMPSEAASRLGAVRSFLGRDRIAAPMVRLVPVLFAAPAGRRFILSDDPVSLANAFSYGDLGLESHGIIVLLPISTELAVALVCPTIIARYEAIDGFAIEPHKRERMIRTRDGFRSGDPVVIAEAELDGWNERQVAGSARRLYSSVDDFDFARRKLAKFPELRTVETHVGLGEIGSPPPPRAGMPEGMHLVITGEADHCMLAIAELDDEGEGLTLRTTNIALLVLVAADVDTLRADLYDGGHIRRSLGGAMIERFGDPREGWFRVVHREANLRRLMRRIDGKHTD